MLNAGWRCCGLMRGSWLPGMLRPRAMAVAVQLPVRVRNTRSVTDTSSGIRAAVPGDIGEILTAGHLAAPLVHAPGAAFECGCGHGRHLQG